MFSGIIKEIGVIEEIRPKAHSRLMSIKQAGISKDAKVGDSISVDGVCLTVADKKGEVLRFDVIKKSLEKCTLGGAKERERVNLEPSLSLNEGISGHLVSGHIDEVGRIRRVARQGRDIMQIMIAIDGSKSSLLVKKGSVAVNGISLTVNDIGKDFFIVDIIPHTYKATTMYLKRIGDNVNIEYDILAKYALKGLSRVTPDTFSADFLKEHGFI
ncbi:MAG: riboflavin synthase [Candidatus Omnitrophica bacterium]|nr:riboflavin synthase [Candidatus Omnitrophota bacterium]